MLRIRILEIEIMWNRIQECVILYSFVLFCVFQQIIRKKLKYKLFFTSLYIKLLILQIKDSSPIGRSDFCEKKLDTFHVVPSCYRTPIPKFYFEMLLSGLSQGLWKCWLLSKTRNGPKNVFSRFWSLCQGGMYSLVF